MPAATYGQFSPTALDPYPIETTLAQQGYGQYPAESQTLMDQYWLERQVNAGKYADEMQQQHEFAKQQLANQLYEANLKGLYEGGKTPGMLQIMAASPTYAGVFGGADAGTIGDVIARQRQGEDVTNLQKAGAGINSVSQAGFDPTQVAGSVGITNLGPYAGPALVQAANINAAARIAAARINASGQGGDRFSSTGPPQADQGGASTRVSYGKGTTFEQAQDRGRQYFGPQSITSGKGGATNLPQAQKDEGTSKGGAAPAAGQGNQAVLDRLRQHIETSGRQALGDKGYADVKAGMAANGGNPIVKQGPDGKPHLYGASGKPYS